MKLDKRSIIFLLNILVFSLDSVLNYFYDFPVFVVSLMFYFVVLIVPGVALAIALGGPGYGTQKKKEVTRIFS